MHTHKVKMKGKATERGGMEGIREGDSEDCSLTSWLGGKVALARWSPPDSHLSGEGRRRRLSDTSARGQTLATQTQGPPLAT